MKRAIPLCLLVAAMAASNAARAEDLQQVKSSLSIMITPAKASEDYQGLQQAESLISAWLIENGWPVKVRPEKTTSENPPAEFVSKVDWNKILGEAGMPDIQLLVEILVSKGDQESIAVGVDLKAVVTATSHKVAETQKVSKPRRNKPGEELRALVDALEQALPELGAQLDSYAGQVVEKGYEVMIKVNNVPADIAMKVFFVIREACTSAKVASQIGRKSGGEDLTYDAVCKKTGGELATVLKEKLSGLSKQVTFEVTTAVTQLVVIEFETKNSKKK